MSPNATLSWERYRFAYHMYSNLSYPKLIIVLERKSLSLATSQSELDLEDLEWTVIIDSHPFRMTQP